MGPTAPTEHIGCHGGQGTMRRFLLLTSKKDPIMSKSNNSVPDYAARFAAASTQSLVEEFNRQVGINAWTSARAVHDQLLIAELQSRGIDITGIYDGHSIDFSHHIRLNETGNRLIMID